MAPRGLVTSVFVILAALASAVAAPPVGACPREQARIIHPLAGWQQADMEFSDSPPADYEGSAPSLSDDGPAGYERSAPEVSNDPPADYEPSAPEVSDDPPSAEL